MTLRAWSISHPVGDLTSQPHGETTKLRGSFIRAAIGGMGVPVMPVTTEDLEHRLAYSVEDVCALTGLSRPLIYDQMSTGKLDYLKVGRRRIITRYQLNMFLGIPSEAPGNS
jgi:excisionase family DNA binding protein